MFTKIIKNHFSVISGPQNTRKNEKMKFLHQMLEKKSGTNI